MASKPACPRRMQRAEGGEAAVAGDQAVALHAAGRGRGQREHLDGYAQAGGAERGLQLVEGLGVEAGAVSRQGGFGDGVERKGLRGQHGSAPVKGFDEKRLFYQAEVEKSPCVDDGARPLAPCAPLHWRARCWTSRIQTPGGRSMTVAAILKQKGSDAVLTITAEATLADCVAHLSQNKVGALIVSTDGNTIAGIISERDIVNAIARKGRGILDEAVGSIMTREVQTCGVDERATELLKRMTTGRFRHLPVVEDGRLRAVISIGDVVKFRVAEIEMEKGALEDMVKGMYV
jgi:CBS domain-containing protein